MAERFEGENAQAVIDALERVTDAVGKVVDDAVVVLSEAGKAFEPNEDDELSELLAELKEKVRGVVSQVESLVGDDQDAP